MFNLTVSGGSVAELQKNLAIAIKALGETCAVEPDENEDEKPKRGRGRPRKSASSAQSLEEQDGGVKMDAEEENDDESQDIFSDEAPSKKTAKKVTMDDVKAITKKLAESKGLPVAQAILKKMGVNLLRELPEEKYAAFVAACEKAND